jgi:molecular chaperone HscA
MDLFEAQFLLKNLLSRIETREDGSRQLPGMLTDGELSALRIALDLLSSQPPSTYGAVKLESAPSSSPLPTTEPPKPAVPENRIELDLSALTSPEPPKNTRLCLDFGTAMSKATLVHDDDATAAEEIHVLQLGVPSDQEEISEVMLISSVYIDNDGMLWFGKAAVDRSMVEGGDGSRQRLDNIKRRLSEEGWDELVGPRFNPTNIPITHGDMVLAYLMFMTWAVNGCLKTLAYPRNLPRRFAMPCLSGEKRRETVHRLTRLVGEAQVLADTFDSTLRNGIALSDFLQAKNELRKVPRSYRYVDVDITEPLGVAGSIISWRSNVDMLTMVVDVGAGTSDFSLYRVHLNQDKNQNTAVEVADSSRGLTEAGNHLDRMLIELIIKKSRITSDDPVWVNVRSALELQIRDFKETLFNDGFVFVTLMNGTEVDIDLNEFLELEPVRQFGDNLRATMIEILESIDSSWVKWVKAQPNRRLVVMLTGGGSTLPMVLPLAKGDIKVKGIDIPVASAPSFPKWLQEIDANLEADYPRVAVSLGGARKQIIQRGNAAHITAGDVTGTPVLGGYYTKGN